MSSKVEAAGAKMGPIGLCWIRRETYEDVKAMMADPDRLYANYDEWLRESKAFETEMAAKNLPTRRIRFHRESFVLFCTIRNLVPDAGARILWAQQEAAKA